MVSCYSSPCLPSRVPRAAVAVAVASTVAAEACIDSFCAFHPHVTQGAASAPGVAANSPQLLPKTRNTLA